MRTLKLKPLLGLCLLTALFIIPLNFPPDVGGPPPGPKATAGNAQTFLAAYDRWKAQGESHERNRLFRLPLSYIKGLSSEFTRAKGVATIDLKTGSLSVKVTDLPDPQNFEVWLVDKKANSGDVRKTLAGVLVKQGNESVLNNRLRTEDLLGFELDQIVISRTHRDAEPSGLLFGSPSIFQKLYYQEIRAGIRPGSFESQGKAGSRFDFLIPAPAHAADPATPDLTALIAEGENLFFNETFGGNGRTCGSCHPAENNFTIDPAFIATLPATDPLFVAEFNPALAQLENPTLLRQFGLILANVDGLEDPTHKFVMRSVPHILGMSMSIQSNAIEAPFQQTGWAGDGAPGGGTLRDFSTGAVTQHFPLTLNRIAGVDFKLPTEHELDAMEAFMLSVGRQEDMDLTAITLTDANAEAGRLLFLAEDSENGTVPAAKCNICHRNAGALTVSGFNLNFITGVENMLHPADATGEPRPRDDGFGTTLNPATGGFGDGSFNTASLLEAADTAPFFHHNGATTLENAIGFYESDEFKNSLEGQRLQLQDTGGLEMTVDVDALAALLRVLNVAENIRSSTAFLLRSKNSTTLADAEKLIDLADADFSDAIGVLNKGGLHPEVIPHLNDAKSFAQQALLATSNPEYMASIDQAVTSAETARDMMIVVPGDTTPPTVSITSPADGAIVFGNSTLSADATDDTGIASVVFVVGPAEVTLTAPPYVIPWDTTKFADGVYSLTVTAFDQANNSDSASLSFTVNNTNPPIDTTPPTVSLTSPSDGSRVSGMVSLSADAWDNVAVASVTFEVGATAGTVEDPPYGGTWDTTAFADGEYQITVTAKDPSNNSQTDVITVTVDNIPDPPDTTPPTVSITSPADGAVVDGDVIFSADAADDRQVEKVIFEVGTTEIGQDLTSPYQLTWDSTLFAEGSQTLKATAVDTSGNSQSMQISVTVDNINCTVYSCPKPPPPPSEPPPPPVMPPGSSPDGDFETELLDKDNQLSTILVDVNGTPTTLKITSQTEFMGTFATNISELLPGHIVQGEFFNATKEVVWIEADLPPGL